MSNIKKSQSEKKISETVLADDERGELTPMQAGFVQAFTEGPTAGNGTKSAIAAGFSEKTAPSQACALLKHPRVTAAIDAKLREAIGSRLSVKAVQVIEGILDNKDAGLKLKGDLAAKVLEFSGIVGRTQAQKAASGEGKTLAEMSRRELQAVIDAGAQVLRAAAAQPGDGAQVIEGRCAPHSAPRAALPDK